uniref:Uncharacterized protein n=1 Tax=Chlorobium chlorochromatii (strain CaD3) TaxID=340177 RepID=Q3ATX7_CHLCH
MHDNPEKSLESVTKLALQFLAEAIGQCPAGLEQSTNQDVVFAVVGFQYGAVQSAAYVAGLGIEAWNSMAGEVIGRLNGIEKEKVAQFLSVMPMLARKKYPPISIGGQAIMRFYNATSEEEKLTAAASLREILRQIDEGN